jgi:hypothetical protein
MELSDSLRPCVTVVSRWFTVRTWLRWTRSDPGPPESRTQCFRACQGSATPPGAGTPCQSGVPAVAFRVFGARRHPGLARFRGSIPCLHVPLSTLHGPRYQGSRMTRSQRGWLDLRCRRLALLHIVPVCLGTPERRASGAAGSGSAADAGRRRLHAIVRLLQPLPFNFATHCRPRSVSSSMSARSYTPSDLSSPMFRSACFLINPIERRCRSSERRLLLPL